MRLFLDYYARNFPVSLTNAGTSVQSVSLKRRDNDEVEVVFAKDTQQIALPTGTMGQLGIKRANDYDGEFLAYSDSWTVTGTAQAPVYVFQLNLNTVEINTIFEESADTIDAINAMMEITWATPDGVVGTSSTLLAKIVNDVVAGEEGLPSFANSTKASQADAEGGILNDKWMTPLRTKQAITAFAPPTTNASLLTSGTLNDARLSVNANSALEKANSASQPGHGHSISEISELTDALNGKAGTNHGHSLQEITQSGASTHQVPTWDGTAWVPQTPAAAQPAKQKVAHEFLVGAVFLGGQYVNRIFPDHYSVNSGREIYAEFTYRDPDDYFANDNSPLIVFLPVPDNSYVSPNYGTGASFGDVFRFKYINPPANRPLKIQQATFYGIGYLNDPSTVLTVSNDSIYSLIFDGTQWVPESTLTGILAETEQKIPIRGQLSRTGTINEVFFPAFTQLGLYGWPPGGSIAATPDESTMYGMSGGGEGSAARFDLYNTSGRRALFSVSAYAEIMHNSSSSAIFGLRLAKNGDSIPATESLENSSANNPAFLTTEWLVELAHGDSVNMHLAQITGTLSSITFRRGRLVAVEVG